MESTFGYNDEVLNKLMDIVSCPICLLPYKTPLLTKCGHSFCKDCINDWLKRREDCPTCNTTLPKNGFYLNYQLQQVTDVLEKESKAAAVKPFRKAMSVMNAYRSSLPEEVKMPFFQESIKNPTNALDLYLQSGFINPVVLTRLRELNIFEGYDDFQDKFGPEREFISFRQIEPGCKYEGEWNNKISKPEGKGVKIWNNGTIYEGCFKTPNAFRGRIIFPNGDYFLGTLVNNKKQGKGTYQWSEGSRYSGDWKDDKQTGKGTYTWTNKQVYEGDFIDGKREGKGVFYWPMGDKYQGDWRNDQRSGKGVYTWKNNDKYVGDFMENKKCGYGVIEWIIGDRYEGMWKDERRNGTGLLVWKNGDNYYGDWVNDRRTGKGTLTWISGDVYEGDFLNDKREGRGILLKGNGTRIEGIWQNDKQV